MTTLLEEVRACLQKNVERGHYLTQNEIDRLNACHFDLSRIDPGVSSLWMPLSEGRKRTIHHIHDEYFPGPNDRVVFKSVNMRGHASAKIKTVFQKNGALDSRYSIVDSLSPKNHSSFLCCTFSLRINSQPRSFASITVLGHVSEPSGRNIKPFDCENFFSISW